MAATRAPTRAPIVFDGQALRRLRVERGLSLRELGDAVGVNPATISRIETANRDPKAVTVVRIAKHLDVDIGGLELLLHD
jgi:transcriptional regulator with XRE-family HTH domain